MSTSKKDKLYYFFVGTEAELIKIFPVIEEFIKRKLNFKIIASGQNDITNSTILAYLKLTPDIYIYRGNVPTTALGMLLWFIKTFFKALFKLKNEFSKLDKERTYMLVHGDTISTVMGSIIAKLYGLKIAHIEAGYRSYDFLQPFPEEIDRFLVSFMADIHFCPGGKTIENIKERKGLKIDTKYNTVIDSLREALKVRITSDTLKKLDQKKYFIFVLHRQENLFNNDRVHNLVNILLDISRDMEAVVVLHEQTKITFEKLGLTDKLEKNKQIHLIPRTKYFEFMHIINNSEFIMTDGGSNQQESYYLGKPCLILRNTVEGTEGIGKNMIISKLDPTVIMEFVQNYKKYRRSPIIPKERPSDIVVNTLQNEK